MQTILDEHGANIASHPSLELIELSDRDDYLAEEIAERKEKSEEKFLARYFLRKVCKTRYISMLEDLHNGHLQKNKGYPDTVEEAYDLINNWKDEARQKVT
eukprot:4620317-Ditylum_brightwellii.AAC.1